MIAKKNHSGSRVRGLGRVLYCSFIVALALSMVPMAGAQTSSPRERAPETIYRDFFPRCDSEGPPGVVSHDWDIVGVIFGDIPRPFVNLPWLFVTSSIARGIDGETGNRTWAVDFGNWHKPPGPEIVNGDWLMAPIRASPLSGIYGTSWPQPYFPIAPVDNVQMAPDLNGDGSCDLIGYGWQYTGVAQQVFSVRVRAIDGYTGEDIWEPELTWTAQRIHQGGIVHVLQDFPTGMLVYDSPTGPRMAFKTLSTVFDYQSEVWTVHRETITVYDATNAEPIWSTQILSPHISATNHYFTGAAQLDGKEDLEVVIDSYNMVPPGGDEVDQDGRGPPRNLTVTAFKGEPDTALQVNENLALDRILWGPTTYYKPPMRGNDPKQVSEETCEFFIFSHAYLVGDLATDGDGPKRPDFVGFYLTDVDTNPAGEQCEPASQNGRLRTHFSPVDGASGRLIWPRQDFKQQGWGFPSDVNLPQEFRYESWGSLLTGATAEETHPYLAIGTVDMPQRQTRGARFPAKELRLTTLKMQDGTPAWGSFSRPFGEDSYLAYDWAVKQYAQYLAGDDYSGDGIRDLVTPAQYQLPNDKIQRLMSTMTHQYEIIDAKKGTTAGTFQPWGPKGMAVYCHEDGKRDLTFLTGYTRRLDLTRVDAFTANQTWRNNLYINAKAQAQTAGIDMGFLGQRCADTPDTRTMFGSSPGLVSLRRGFEILPIYGYFEEQGAIDWLLPEVQYQAPMGATLDPFLDISEPPPTLKENVGMTTFSVLSGIGAAFGAVTLFNRTRRPGGA